MKKEETKSTSIVVARINNVAILVGNTSEKLVPIKPICLALGIDDKAQKNRIERDEILNSVKVMATSTASDGKVYEMVHLPLRYALGWLFSIDHNAVKEEAKPFVIKYKRECIDALDNHFIQKTEFERWQLEEFLRLDEIENAIRGDFRECSRRIKEVKQQKIEVKAKKQHDWSFENSQMTIPFPENKKIELNQEEA